MYGWMGGGWLDECMDGLIDGSVVGCMNGWLDA